MYSDDPLSGMTTGLLLSLILTLYKVGTPPVVGGAQATVSWSTDGLFSVIFPTAPGEAGRGRREGRGRASMQTWVYSDDPLPDTTAGGYLKEGGGVPLRLTGYGGRGLVIFRALGRSCGKKGTMGAPITTPCAPKGTMGY